jgi:Flp pilus assembly protein TadB
VTTGDRRHNEELSVHIKYSEEIAEQLKPAPGIAEPVYGPENYARVERWKINRVFYFLSFISVGCLCALVLSPVPTVQVAVVGIWTGAAGLCRYLLSTAYDRDREHKT